MLGMPQSFGQKKPADRGAQVFPPKDAGMWRMRQCLRRKKSVCEGFWDVSVERNQHAGYEWIANPAATPSANPDKIMDDRLQALRLDGFRDTADASGILRPLRPITFAMGRDSDDRNRREFRNCQDSTGRF